jgi:hypothetical protein
MGDHDQSLCRIEVRAEQARLSTKELILNSCAANRYAAERAAVHGTHADWPEAWIIEGFERCCGKKDYEQMADGGVTRDADGSYIKRETPKP